ncbi:hypothetical protein [Mycolicibacterium sp. F2034L]|uniref:hypothetical protein n=1 Tax=Mycolicibacterium sp. F2034L TaxID=2926422 RepID=UPI001FF21C82|nr:hypothetical protein [Mycolicibacterium sp. F2034L]MCK0174800.1 hypothetical protein [Mycolicibacterium sp. F2034L]
MAAPTPPTSQDVALSAARSFCGWHVTPEREDEAVVFDGPGARLLALPTLRLVELTAVSEDGVELDLADLEVSARGLVRKRNGGWWSGRFGAIVVTMTHGYDEADAAGFTAAVASFAERHAAGDKPRVIGPVQWDSVAMADGSAFTVVERSLLEKYRLESAP